MEDPMSIKALLISMAVPTTMTTTTRMGPIRKENNI